MDNPPDSRFLPLGQDDFTTIGRLDFQTGNDWLNNTGGIVVFDNLPDEVSSKLVNQQLILLSPSSDNPEQFVLLAREAKDGYVIRADNCVQRLDAEQTNEIDIYAYQWGEPLASQDIAVSLEAPTPVLRKGDPNGSPICETPGNNYPQDGIDFYSSIQTDPNGRAVLHITGNAIHNPRVYIDGQIYFLDYELQNIPNDPATAALEPDRISVHLRDYFELTEDPSWSDIAETMTQYSNLYPIMSKYIVNLSDPVAVKAKKNILMFAFTRGINDSLHMPVTRDLSEAKRQAILRWLAADDLNLGEKDSKVVMSLQSQPAVPGAKLTEKQIKAIKMMKMKGGADFLPGETSDSSEDQ